MPSPLEVAPKQGGQQKLDCKQVSRFELSLASPLKRPNLPVHLLEEEQVMVEEVTEPSAGTKLHAPPAETDPAHHDRPTS